jgi:hypothetical protein
MMLLQQGIKKLIEYVVTYGYVFACKNSKFVSFNSNFSCGGESSHKGSKDTKNNTNSTFNLRETSCFGVFLPAVQDFGRRVWQEKGYMRNC